MLRTMRHAPAENWPEDGSFTGHDLEKSPTISGIISVKSLLISEIFDQLANKIFFYLFQGSEVIATCYEPTQVQEPQVTC